MNIFEKENIESRNAALLIVKNKWIFDNRSYPEINEMTPNLTRLHFELNHCLLHMCKHAEKLHRMQSIRSNNDILLVFKKDEIIGDDTMPAAQIKEVIVKMLIVFLRIELSLHSYDQLYESFEVPNPEKRNFHECCLFVIAKVSAFCELLDHGVLPDDRIMDEMLHNVHWNLRQAFIWNDIDPWSFVKEMYH